MLQISAALGLPRLKNNQIRTTAIRYMVRGGLDDRYIQTVSKHKILATLNNYAPVPEMSKRFEGAQALMTVKKPKRRIETVTSEITKKISKTSIIEEAAEQNSFTSKKQVLHLCPKCLKYFGSKFGLKNHPCPSNDEIETKEISETDSFDAIISQAHR